VVGGGTLCPLRIVREPRRDPARLRVHRLLPRGGCRRRLGGGGLRGAGGRAVSAAAREGAGGDEADHPADPRDQAAGRRAAGPARAAGRTAALALGQAGPGLARATVALGGLVLVSETHAAYAPSTSSGNTSYSVYSSYDGSRAGPRAGAVWGLDIRETQPQPVGTTGGWGGGVPGVPGGDRWSGARRPCRTRW